MIFKVKLKNIKIKLNESLMNERSLEKKLIKDFLLRLL